MKYTIFREMLDYMAHITKVTDADMDDYCHRIVITGETEDQVITIEVSIEKKEVTENAEELE